MSYKIQPWQTQVINYARVISGGRWKPYDWLRRTMPLVQRKIVEGGARIIVCAPPRHGKSNAFTQHMTGWFLTNYPRRQSIIASYSTDKARDWGRDIRDDMQPHGLVNPKHAAASDWSTPFGGGCKSVGVGGPIIGRGADLFVFDDPHKNRELAYSQGKLEELRNWWTSTAYTRLEPNASVVVVMQRWHDNDFVASLLDLQPEAGWIVLTMPAISVDGLDDFLDRPPGMPLCPERYTLEMLNEIRESVGPLVWSGMYQQDPIASGGKIFQPEWYGRWSSNPDRADARYLDLTDPDLAWCQSWDTKFKEGVGSHVVGDVWVAKGPRRYLVDQERGQWGLPGTIAAIRRLSSRWPESAHRAFIEDKATGPAVVELLRNEMAFIPVTPLGSKLSRAIAIQGIVESGNVYLPHELEQPWALDVRSEYCAFPVGTADDRVDTKTQALLRLRQIDRPLLLGFL